MGPTATGKTDLGLYLAKKFNGEIVACDSRQVYKGLDIGTGKLPGNPVEVVKGRDYWQVDGIKIWMYDVADLNTQYTAADYVRGAKKVINDIINRRHVPIIAGGTGFYLKVLTSDLPNLSVPIDEKLRDKLGRLSLEELQTKLQQLSPVRWKELNSSDRPNPRRLLRSIEILSMNPYINRQQYTGNSLQSFDVLKIGLTAPREVLYKKVDLRVFDWINQGIIEEVKKLLKSGISVKRIRQLGLEYRIIADFLEGKIAKEDLVKTIQNSIHGYIRRQLTWFRKTDDVHWFDITDKNYQENVENLSRGWYHNRDDQEN